MTDLVSRLLEAIEAKEEKARTASPSPWTLHRDSFGDDRWADISAADGSSPVDTESGTIGPNLATAEFMVDNDPSSVLRRCAADRRIVERHRHFDFPFVGDEGGMSEYSSEAYCEHCNCLCPCPDLKDLAAGYGITDHQEGEA